MPKSLKYIFLPVFLVVVCAWIIFYSGLVKAQVVLPVSLAGYAWSSNIGWISFDNGTNGNNQVVIDSSTGSMIGYAWSSNIGWIKFGGLSNFPTGSGTTASNAIYNSSTGKMSGWVRACSATVDGKCGGTTINKIVTIPSHTSATTTYITSTSTNVFKYNDSQDYQNYVMYSYPPNDANFSYYGSYTDDWVAPPGVNKVTVQVWGAGGAGASNDQETGGDGGNGGYSSGFYTVVPGTTYHVNVGSGGSGDCDYHYGGSTASHAAASGDSSSFGPISYNFLIAYGGGGGIGCWANPAGGAGGGASGGNISNITGATGGPGTSYGSNGSTPGYGGSGCDPSLGSCSGGGTGGMGQVILTYAQPITTSTTTTQIIATSTATTTTDILDNGWDGWISLSGTNYGISASSTFSTTNPLSGYAWGADVVGWIDFSRVSISNLCSLTNSCILIPTTFVLEVSGSSCSTINLSWSSVPNATTYNVYRSTSSGGTYTKIASGLTSKSYVDNNSIVPNTIYYYEISASNTSGESGLSTPVQSNPCNTCSNGAIPPNCTKCNTGQSFIGGICAFKSVSSVGISNFSVSPSTINKGGNCNLSWVLTPTPPDASSTCAIYKGSTLVTSFAPNSSIGSYLGSSGGDGVTKNISNETTYKLSCGETDSSNTLVQASVVNKYATCYINQNYKETD